MPAETDLILNQKSNLYHLSNIVKKNPGILDEIGDVIPGMLHLNNTRDFGLEYINHFGRELFTHYDFPEIKRKGIQFLQDVLAPNSLHQIKPLYEAFSAERDSTKVITFFQSFRRDEREQYQWFFTTKKFLELDQMTIAVSTPIAQMDETVSHFRKIFGENKFLMKNLERFNQLTKREKEITKKIAQGYTSQQISDRLFISKHTVSTHRKNIHRKLEVKGVAGLVQYVQVFGL